MEWTCLNPHPERNGYPQIPQLCSNISVERTFVTCLDKITNVDSTVRFQRMQEYRSSKTSTPHTATSYKMPTRNSKNMIDNLSHGDRNSSHEEDPHRVAPPSSAAVCEQARRQSYPFAGLFSCLNPTVTTSACPR